MANTTDSREALREYAVTAAAEAASELQAARERLAAAKTKTARRAAYDDIEFWGNKAAFLSHAKI